MASKKPSQSAVDITNKVSSNGSSTKHPVQTVHPEYNSCLQDWQYTRDWCTLTERQLKAKGTVYLPKTSGQLVVSDGEDRYKAYKMRARCYGLVRRLYNKLAGIIHSNPPSKVELPTSLDYLKTSCTLNKEPLSELAMQVTRGQLISGRVPIVVDAGANEGGEPYLVRYNAEQLINWKGLVSPNLAVFSSMEQDSVGEANMYDHKNHQVYYAYWLDQDGIGWYEKHRVTETGVVKEIDATVWDVASNGQLPIHVIGSIDLTLHCDPIPMQPAAESEHAIYRLSADYFQGIYYNTQSTLVLYGDVSMESVGNESVIKAGAKPHAHVEYLETTGTGIERAAEAMKEERAQIRSHGVDLQRDSNAAESGDSLFRRSSDQRANLKTMARAAGMGIQLALRDIAVLKNEDPEDVIYEPDLTFNDVDLDVTDLRVIADTVSDGNAPLEILHQAYTKLRLYNDDFDKFVEDLTNRPTEF